MKIGSNPLSRIIRSTRSTFLSVGLFSSAVNILMLTGPIFMLQIYDRVLSSRSVPTLIALSALVIGLYVFMGIFTFIRSRILSNAGYRFDMELMGATNKMWLSAGLNVNAATTRPINDLTAIRKFFCSNGLPALFDLPWVPIYLIIVYLLHPWLGYLATGGAAFVVLATIANEYITKNHLAQATHWELRDANFSERAQKNASAIFPMGMVGNLTNYWKKIRINALSRSQIAIGRSEIISAISKTSRMLLQSAILGLGAYLAILQEITPGTMIAASILAGRALSPVDQAIGNWKNFILARQSYDRLSNLFKVPKDKPEVISLPEPESKLSLEGILKLAPSTGGEAGKILLQGVEFDLVPGDCLGVIGPSGSGKSCLARLLVGLWMPDRGTVRLDGATYDQWDRDELGKNIGYLPQSVELMAGTIGQNIARFDPDVEDNEIIEAAKLAGVHDMILSLKDGYATDLSSSPNILSGGQSQRVALARAVFRTPALIVLDEPNANLDSQGDAAMTNAVVELRKRGACVAIMAHRPSAIAAVNKVVVLKEGRQVEFGPKDEVLQKVTKLVSPSTNLKNKSG